MEITNKFKKISEDKFPSVRKLFAEPSNETPITKFYRTNVQSLYEVKNMYCVYACIDENEGYIDKPSSTYCPSKWEGITMFNKLELKTELENICTFIDTSDSGYYTRDAIEEKLSNLLITFKTRTLPSKPCYITNLPSDLFLSMLAFLNPWDLYNITSINKHFKKEICKVSNIINEYYSIGRVLNFAYNNTWNIGIILCDSQHNHEYHVLLYSYKVISISKSDIAKFSCCNIYRVPPLKCFKDYVSTYFCYDPHEVNSKGYKIGTFSSKSVPHYTCNILADDIRIAFKENMLGRLYDISKLPLHKNHKLAWIKTNIDSKHNDNDNGDDSDPYSDMPELTDN